MPNFDRTGPKGHGILTGRGQGPCVNKGMRKGRCNTVLYSLEDEEKSLKARLKQIEEEKNN